MLLPARPCVKFYSFTVLEVSGADGLVSDTISWMARRSLSRCRGLLMPISRWISVSDSADMMAPLFTLARQAATYHAGIPTHSCRRSSETFNEASLTFAPVQTKGCCEAAKVRLTVQINILPNRSRCGDMKTAKQPTDV